MSIGGGDGITLHKITKCADITRKIKSPHGSEFTLKAGSESVSGSGFNESGSTTLLAGRVLQLLGVWATLAFPIFYTCNDDIKHPPMTVLYVTVFFCV